MDSEENKDTADHVARKQIMEGKCSLGTYLKFEFNSCFNNGNIIEEELSLSQNKSDGKKPSNEFF